MTRGRGWERQGQAVAGIMERLEPPAILGPYNLIDIGTGTLTTFATGLAVYHKLRTGEGQQAQASLAQTATYQQAPFMLDYDGYTPDEPRGYTALGTGPLNRFYQASDGWFFLAVKQEDAAKLATVEGLEKATGEGIERALETAIAGADAHTVGRPAQQSRPQRPPVGEDRRHHGERPGESSRSRRHARG